MWLEDKVAAHAMHLTRGSLTCPNNETWKERGWCFFSLFALNAANTMQREAPAEPAVERLLRTKTANTTSSGAAAGMLEHVLKTVRQSGVTQNHVKLAHCCFIIIKEIGLKCKRNWFNVELHADF